MSFAGYKIVSAILGDGKIERFVDLSRFPGVGFPEYSHLMGYVKAR